MDLKVKWFEINVSLDAVSKIFGATSTCGHACVVVKAYVWTAMVLKKNSKHCKSQ